jgi:hypothetical protein
MSGFVLLAREAARDALRRRFAVAVAIVLTLSLLWVRSCTDFGNVSFNQRAVDPALIAGFLAPVLFSLQALAVLLIAGVLASDHLRELLAQVDLTELADPTECYHGRGLRRGHVVGIAGD